MSWRWRHRAVAAVALAAAALLAAPAAAFAHAAFLGSSPAPGQRLERAPAQLVLRFTEALNRRLSTASLYAVPSGRRVAVRVSAPASARLALVPVAPLPRGAYRVEWHSVSADDGHALEGSFSFGVRAAAVGGVRTGAANPLSGAGWLRLLVRALLYPALFVFAAALLLGAIGRRGSATWLTPAALEGVLGKEKLAALRGRARTAVIDLGLAAAALAAASAILDAAHAAGGVHVGRMTDYLLSGSAGIGRLAVPVLLALAVAGAAAHLRSGSIAVALALGAVVASGHAGSASPRLAAIAIDWAHLLAGTVWLGGIGLIALAWWPVTGAPGPQRREVARHVLESFGRIALPAFAIVAASGVGNAVLALGRPSALWESGYGRALLVKVGVVAVLAAISFVHALRLRPRLVAANPHPPERVEAGHWKLARGEPLVGILLAVVVAVLVALPVPREDAGASSINLGPTCSPCPLRLPAAGELAVAEAGGTDVVAAWLRRTPGEVSGELRLLDMQGRPAADPFEIEDAGAVSISCGPGCRRFRLPGTPAELRVSVRQQDRTYVAVLPARWQRGAAGRARALLKRAQRTMRALRAVRETEETSSVPGRLPSPATSSSRRIAWPTPTSSAVPVTRPCSRASRS